MPQTFLELRCNTLTPIWTGDVDGDAGKEVFATSVLGGLRWWYEALLRGVMARIPDVTETKPRFDAAKGPDALDPACRLFGATGWRRRFRLDVDSSRMAKARIATRIPSTHKSWYFKSQPLEGEFGISVTSLDPNLPAVETIHELLTFAAAWGSLGARPQMGFGLFRLDRAATGELAGAMAKHKFWGNPEKRVMDGGMPALHNMFFARVGPRPGAPFDETTTFQIKRGIRELFRQNEGLRHFLAGHIQAGSDDRNGSKIFVSRFYPAKAGKEIRVWGWYPRDENGYANERGVALQQIYGFLKTAFQLRQWKEVGSKERDREFVASPLAFFRKLMASES
jgi:CRISPR-associated protein Cmr1